MNDAINWLRQHGRIKEAQMLNLRRVPQVKSLRTITNLLAKLNVAVKYGGMGLLDAKNIVDDFQYRSLDKKSVLF